jgi:Kef-type K+ transport system membrane component KefB
MQDDFYLFAAVLGIAAAAGLLANRLRQPLIVAFIGVGIAVGPAGLGWIEGTDPLELLAEIGIAVLLFLVGLKLDLHLVRTTGPVALATGLGQVAFTCAVGFVLGLLLGLDATTAFYVAIALTFSSTIIIVKLLSDKRELEQQHGRIAVGFLIVQDIVVVIMMIVITAVGGVGDDTVLTALLSVIGKGVGLLLGIVIVTRYVLPRFLHLVASSPELLVLSSVAWAVLLAATSDWLGFSSEVGAFLAGISLASTEYREAIGARLVPLRDFLLLFFFLQLGAQLEFDDAGSQIARASVLSAFVLIGNPIIVLVIMGLMGYRKRTAFLAGLTVAQISEFSLILIALALSLGHVDSSAVGLVTVVGLITIGLSTYLILYSHPLYERLEPALSIFERSGKLRELEERPSEAYDVIVYGFGRYGSSIVDELVQERRQVLVVESDPSVVATRTPPEGAAVVYGDAEDLEFAETLPLAGTAWVLCTIAQPTPNLALLHALRHMGYDGRVALTAHTPADAERLSLAGADLVLQPFADAATHVAELLAAEAGPSRPSGQTPPTG